jgi:hypothetical protein
MILLKRIFCLLPVAALILATGCVVKPYDYTAFNESKPKSILVIPPVNNSVEVNAPYIYLSTITKPLAEKGYYVFPVAVIDNFLKENGLPTPAEMNTIPLDKIREHFGADAVLYVTIEDWGQKYNVLSSQAVVKAHLSLVDTKSGKQIWDAHANAVQAQQDNGGGLIGALIGAIVGQIAGSLSDTTPALSRNANNLAINSEKRGLLHGPYNKPSSSQVTSTASN